jgi:hypothetical protein
MALSGVIQSEDTNVGVYSDRAYARIIGYEGDKELVTIHVEIHINQEARFSGKAPIHVRKESVQTYEVNSYLLPTLYGFLKTCPLFSGWVDV